jgi:hypothetical protein
VGPWMPRPEERPRAGSAPPSGKAQREAAFLYCRTDRGTKIVRMIAIQTSEDRTGFRSDHASGGGPAGRFPNASRTAWATEEGDPGATGPNLNARERTGTSLGGLAAV